LGTFTKMNIKKVWENEREVDVQTRESFR
jgi:hypothetical protein